jgi:hypothetical protein
MNDNRAVGESTILSPLPFNFIKCDESLNHPAATLGLCGLEAVCFGTMYNTVKKSLVFRLSINLLFRDENGSSYRWPNNFGR